MSQRSLAVIINPASRSGSSLTTHELVASRAKALGVDVIHSECRGHATELANGCAMAGIERVVAVGGDGTINEVMNGLVGSSTALAVVPTGTGNDWIRSVGIPCDPDAAWRIAMGGRIVTSDVGEAVGHRYFLNVAGVGFDAEVARCIADAKGLLARLGPKSRYIASVFKTLLLYKGSAVKVVIDGEETNIQNLFLLAVANARYYGSGMQIAPQAEYDDGLFDLVWGHGISRLEVGGLVKKIYSGGHVSHKKVVTKRCREVTLVSEQPLSFHLDGDVVGRLPVTFRIIKDAIKIVVP